MKLLVLLVGLLFVISGLAATRSTLTVGDTVSVGDIFSTTAGGCQPGVAVIPDTLYGNKVSASTTYFYGGFIYSTNATTTVCSVTFYLTQGAGELSTQNFTAKVWSTTGENYDLDTVIGQSSAVVGTNTWSLTPVLFTLSSPVALNQDVVYAFTLESDSADASNYAMLTAKLSDAVPGHYQEWFQSKAYAFRTLEFDCGFILGQQ